MNHTLRLNCNDLISNWRQKGSNNLSTWYSNNNGQELKLYNGKTDKEIATLTSYHTGKITPKFSLDGEYVAMSSANEFRVWKADKNEEIIAFRTSRDIVSYSFGPGSKTISLIEENGTLTEIDVSTKAVRPTVQTEIYGDRVLSAHWGQNNDYVITFENDAKFHYYRSNGKPFDTTKTENEKISPVHFFPKFSRDGRYAAIGGKNIFVYDLLMKKLIYSSDDTFSKFCHFTFDPSGRFLVVGSKDGVLQIFDLSTGKQIQSLSEHERYITQLNFSPSGSFFVSSGRNGTTLWKVAVDNDFKNLTDERSNR